MSVTRTAYSSDEYSPNKIIKTEDYESYIINHEPVTSNNITNNIQVKTNINTNTNGNVNAEEVHKTYKTLNETQKFNQSGIIKESFNHILYENKNWTQKKKYPVIEIEKEQTVTPIKTIKSVDKVKNIKTVKKVQKAKKEREFPPNFIRKRDKPKKKRIILKVYDYDENNANEYNNQEYVEGNNFNENENVVEETFVKKIIRKEEELLKKGDGEIFHINKTRHYKKKPIKILSE
jgi:hypothetical protein